MPRSGVSRDTERDMDPVPPAPRVDEGKKLLDRCQSQKEAAPEFLGLGGREPAPGELRSICSRV